MIGSVPVEPLYDPEAVRPLRTLRGNCRRIDGWGPLAWKEVLGAWQLPGTVLVIERPEWPLSGDEDERLVALIIDHRLGRGDPLATADWVLRRAWDTLLGAPAIAAWTVRPGAAMRATNACFLQEDGRLVVRFHVLLPYAGMCLDARRFLRFLRQVAAFATDLATPGRRPALARHRRAAAIQDALRAALPGAGLVAFLGAGSVLPRNAQGGPADHGRPLEVPAAWQRTLDLGRLGTVTGLGIPRGVTALAGAPYHGKSTVLQAIAAGIWNHPPGDGRERVVADPTTLYVQAEDGRRIKDTDLSAFFRTLPGADPARFRTDRASGATSMVASLVQGIAAGSRLLLIDEDTAASNALAIDGGMRRLLGSALDGTTTVLDLLPALAAAGISTVLVAGSSTASLAAAGRVIVLDHFQPRDATAQARAIVARHEFGSPASHGAARPAPGWQRRLTDHPDAVFGPRHFLRLDVGEPERPRITVGGATWILDLRRSGWEWDGPLAAGAILAAAWCCRLAAGDCAMADLADRYARFVAAGPAHLDPFHTALVAVPPWPQVVSVLERLPSPRMRSSA